MKTNLLITLSLTACLAGIISPLASKAQCLCDGGIPPTEVKHLFTLDTTDAASATIIFPKFNPTIGTLTCVQFSDTISLVSTTHVTNTASFPVTFKFLMSATNEYTGPGFSVNETATRVYGPTTLGRHDSADKAVYGPDTLFENSSHQSNTSDVTGYFGGTGDVSFDYTVNGGLLTTQGGMNADYQIISRYWGNFGLTYYWCPTIVMSTNIKNFTAVKSNKNVNLTWIVGNNLTSNTYEIQVSKNGREFFGTGSTQTSSASSGASAKYAYQYNPNQAVTGQLYFRIKQTDANGKISYSTVKALNMDHNTASTFSAYPNPVVNKVSLQFDANLDGDFNIDVTNQVGQVVISRPMRLKNTNLIDLNLGKVNAPGLYYVRVKDASTGQVFTNKILINR
ncbi:choice-of-anchor E domain-containing protein [Flavitalea sp.]|nr:choice-of-anchor E domain-containing protein [Flavitalea sp.]